MSLLISYYIIALYVIVKGKELRVTLSIINSNEIELKEDLETFLMTSLVSWGLQGSKVTGVVCDLDQDYLLQVAAQLYPNAGITSCIFKACDHLYKSFQDEIANVGLVQSKIISTHDAIKYVW